MRGRMIFWLLLAAPSFLSTGCSPSLEAALLLSDIAAGEEASLYKRVTPDPSRTRVEIDLGARRHKADLYRSPEGSRAALLLVPGAARAGKDDPRLVAFAQSLARARFAVLVPDLPSFRSLRVHSGDIDTLAGIFAWMIRHPGIPAGGQAGMAAFSYAVGPAILAAMEPPLRPEVDFILAIGPYYDLSEVLLFFTTGWFRHEGTWQRMEPNAYGKWIFILSNLHRLPESDRPVLQAMAERKTADLQADVSDLAGQLSPTGRSLYDFVVNAERHRAIDLMRNLPETVRREIAALDLANKNLAPLQADLILIHGYEDSIIPFPQSLALDAALPEEQARLYLVHGLFHVDLEPGLKDKWKLWKALRNLLGHRSSD